MSTRYSVDAEVFQRFLANAYAVQESGLDRRSLSAVIEIQRVITDGNFDLDGAMQMIADRALGVSHASGVTIGLLEPNRNELVYRAGSGHGAKDIGRRVPAVLSACSATENRREILRVENADSDTRIEAEICRQFGAKSLLMLPIYKDHALAGVLQVLFQEAHCFPEREVRAYRLMLGALEEGILRSASTVSKPEPMPAIHEIPKHEIPQEVAFEQSERRVEAIEEPPAVLAQAAREDVSSELLRSFKDRFTHWSATVREYQAIVVRELRTLRDTVLRFVEPRLTQAWGAGVRSSAAAIGAAIVLSIAVWIAHHHASANANADLSSSVSREVQAPDKAVAGADEVKAVTSVSKQSQTHGRAFRRVRVGPNEVDYIADDVTIRTFEPVHPKPQIRADGREVKFGDDVTVRYFAKSPTLASDSAGTSETAPVPKPE